MISPHAIGGPRDLLQDFVSVLTFLLVARVPQVPPREVMKVRELW